MMARSLGRKIGLNRLVASWLGRSGYEACFYEAFCGALRNGDIVWDVGANIGSYTRLFAEHVGPDGKVFAFEPSPINFERLERECGALNNVVLIQMGLGGVDDIFPLIQGEDELGATSRIAYECSINSWTVSHFHMVKIRTGKRLIEEGEAEMPSAIKIDVEGFELEVLQGIGDRLESPTLHTIGIEVHFGILEERGLKHVPRQIERLLAHKGFLIQWSDSSHILATRAGT